MSNGFSTFAQNEKSLEHYTDRVNKGQLPIFRGHRLSSEDLIIRKHILNIMCHFETSWKEMPAEMRNKFEVPSETKKKIEDFYKDFKSTIGPGTKTTTENRSALPEHQRITKR